MLVVKIELRSAVTGRTTVIGEAIIANDGTDLSHGRGNYDVYVGAKRDVGDLLKIYQKPLRKGRVESYPRVSYNVWRLVQRALASAFPEEKVTLPDVDDEALAEIR